MPGWEAAGVVIMLLVAVPPLRTAARPTEGRTRGVPSRESAAGCTGCCPASAAAAALCNAGKERIKRPDLVV